MSRILWFLMTYFRPVYLFFNRIYIFGYRTYLFFERIFYKIFYFLVPIYQLLKKYFYILKSYYEFFKNKLLAYIEFRKKLRAKYKEVREENIKLSIKNCIEGSGGVKNILKVKSTINTIKIWVNFTNLTDLSKIKECSSAGFKVSDNLIEIITGEGEAKRICSSLKLSLEKLNNLYTFSGSNKVREFR